MTINKPNKKRRGYRGKNKKGVHPSSSTYKKYRRRNTQPWLLVTSLASDSPETITQLYAKRMQCEEGFRDYKSHRFGFSFNDAASRSPERMLMLWVIATLAHFVAMLIGLAAEAAALAPRYQANTERKRRVLSLVTLGVRIIANPPTPNHLKRLQRDVALRWPVLLKTYPTYGDP